MTATDSKQTILIRTATVEDSAALAELGAQTFSETFAHLYSSKDLNRFLVDDHSVSYYQDLLAQIRTLTLVAELSSGKAIAYATATPCKLPVPALPDNAGELQRLYVREGWQGSGLGARLFSQAMRYLQDQFDHIYLGVYSENLGAQRFYRRHGFTKVAQYQFMVGDHADEEWIMQWQGQPMNKHGKRPHD